MSDLITVQGVVLSAMPIGEYDKRLVLLTRERGKIAVFAKGARRPRNPFMAAANPFVFGTFILYEGKTSYNLNQVSVSHQFVELAAKQPGVYYGYYFLELADYFGKEGVDEREMMNLLYVAVKALLNPVIDDRLARCVYELRVMAIQGFCPYMFGCVSCEKEIEADQTVYFSQSLHGIVCSQCVGNTADSVRISSAAWYAMKYMIGAPLEKLYGFTVKEEVLIELEQVIHTYMSRNTDKRFKSLEILEMMC